MPESPEVQALVEFLDERVRDRAVAAVEGIDPRVVKTRDRPPAELVGARISGVRRFGKYLGIDTGAGWLAISFGRNGWIRWNPSETDPGVAGMPLGRLVLNDGAVVELVETGDFLAVSLWVVSDPAEVAGIAALGPDPISDTFAPDDLDRSLGRRRKQIKALLQEQQSLAGIGNGYSDEILHAARLAPTIHAAVLSDDERARLYEAATGVLRGAVADRRGVAPALLKKTKAAAMTVHGRGGSACPVCGTTIVDTVFAGASAQLCPNCQPAGATT